MGAEPYIIVRSSGDTRYVRDKRSGRDIGPIHWREAWRLKVELNADPPAPLRPFESVDPSGGRR